MAPIAPPHGATRRRSASRNAERTIRRGITEGHPGEFCPHGFLKDSAANAEREVELGSSASEVLVELGAGGLEHGSGVLGDQLVGQNTLALDGEGGDRLAVAGDLDAAEGAGEAGEVRGGCCGHGSTVAAASVVGWRFCDSGDRCANRAAGEENTEGNSGRETEGGETGGRETEARKQRERKLGMLPVTPGE